jgi:hypothetical protein
VWSPRPLNLTLLHSLFFWRYVKENVNTPSPMSQNLHEFKIHIKDAYESDEKQILSSVWNENDYGFDTWRNITGTHIEIRCDSQNFEISCLCCTNFISAHSSLLLESIFKSVNIIYNHPVHKCFMLCIFVDITIAPVPLTHSCDDNK